MSSHLVRVLGDLVVDVVRFVLAGGTKFLSAVLLGLVVGGDDIDETMTAPTAINTLIGGKGELGICY